MCVSQAEEWLLWYEYQFKRLNAAITAASPYRLITQLDEHEKEPSIQQLQRAMTQACGLRHFYSLCTDREIAKVMGLHWKDQNRLLVNLAKRAGEGAFVSASTLLMWHRECVRYDAHFPLDCRGKHEWDYLLCNEDLWFKFETRMTEMAGDETLTLDAAQAYVNNDLLNTDYSHLRCELEAKS